MSALTRHPEATSATIRTMSAPASHALDGRAQIPAHAELIQGVATGEPE